MDINRNFKPKIPLRSMLSAFKVLHSGDLVQGEKVEKLESLFQTKTGWKHAIAVSNATAGLHLSLKLVIEDTEDEVILPAYSFVASANSVHLAGGQPRFVDVEQDSYLTSASKMIAATNSRTKAFMVVHEFGSVMPFSVLEDFIISTGRKIFLIHDAACALGVPLVSNPLVNSFAVYSFHPRKIITSGEGGMILTNSDEAASRLRALRNHGFQVNSTSKDLVEAGYNYRLTDLQASILLPQLENLNAIVEKRRKRFILLKSKLNSKSIEFMVPEIAESNLQTLSLRISEERNPSEFVDHMTRHGIQVIRPAQFIPREDFYRKFTQLSDDISLPNLENSFERIFAVPFSQRMKGREIRRMVKVLNDF